MIENGKVKDHSGSGSFWGNLIATGVTVVLFLGCLYAMSFWDFTNVWIPGLLALGLAVLTFIIPQQVLGRSDLLKENEARIHAEPTAVQRHGH